MGFRWPIEIDGLPFLKMVIFHGYVKKPDGNIFQHLLIYSNIYECILAYADIPALGAITPWQNIQQ